MVTMAVRQAAAKAKPIEVLRIMTITCDEGPKQTPRRRFRSAQLVIKIKGKCLAGMAEFADDRRRQGVPRVRFAPPSCSRRFRSAPDTSSDSFELSHGHRAGLIPGFRSGFVQCGLYGKVIGLIDLDWLEFPIQQAQQHTIPFLLSVNGGKCWLLLNAYAWLGRCKLAIGSVDEVIPLVEYAIRLSPHDRRGPC